MYVPHDQLLALGMHIQLMFWLQMDRSSYSQLCSYRWLSVILVVLQATLEMLEDRLEEQNSFVLPATARLHYDCASDQK